MTMVRNKSDIWPNDVPIGTFDIHLSKVEGYNNTASILFVCPNNKRCSILLGEQFIPRPNEDSLCVWQWDGNIEQPTIKPSINCISEKDGKPTGGCGWHGYITNGVMQ